MKLTPQDNFILPISTVNTQLEHIGYVKKHAHRRQLISDFNPHIPPFDSLPFNPNTWDKFLIKFDTKDL